MFDEETIQKISAAAKKHSLELAALLAVAELESGACAFVTIAGQKRPVIRFEGHYFDRRLSPEKRARARAEGLAAPHAGAVANPAAQAARWRLLARAEKIDRRAAREATSWGIGQVMGVHWAWLGYADVDALVADVCAGVEGQVDLMMRYIQKAGLTEALRRHDWHAFARGYNGPEYRRNGYHMKLADAYHRYSKTTTPNSAATMLRQGMRGDPVRDLQRLLSAHGYSLKIDGAFGPETARALRQFQRDHGLTIDAIAGPETLSALKNALPLAPFLHGLWMRICHWLRAMLT